VGADDEAVRREVRAAKVIEAPLGVGVENQAEDEGHTVAVPCAVTTPHSQQPVTTPRATPPPVTAASLTVPVQLRFADLDPLGHVNNVAFFTLMETARVRFMHELAGTLRGHVLVARSECDHRREIPASTQVIDVTVQAESVGRTSFVLRHDLVDGGVEVDVGRVVLVAIDDRHRPRPLTDAERTGLLGS